MYIIEGSSSINSLIVLYHYKYKMTLETYRPEFICQRKSSITDILGNQWINKNNEMLFKDETLCEFVLEYFRAYIVV